MKPRLIIYTALAPFLILLGLLLLVIGMLCNYAIDVMAMYMHWCHETSIEDSKNDLGRH